MRVLATVPTDVSTHTRLKLTCSVGLAQDSFRGGGGHGRGEVPTIRGDKQNLCQVEVQN